MKLVKEQRLLAAQDYDCEELALELFDRSIEMNRRSEMTAEEIWVTIGEGGDHFFPSVDEMIADRGTYVQPHNREQLEACLGEYSLKLDKCDLDLAKANDSRTFTNGASNPENVVALQNPGIELMSDESYWDSVCSEMFFNMNRVLHSASSLAWRARQATRACEVM
jgi:hypothetical protein